ncbi:MAG: prolyl oligopeptidase family serine peptidase [Clostridia bacterium]|nr:prolyl oligopeptidase family serine peptidase [Clostridia bacterium]
MSYTEELTKIKADVSVFYKTVDDLQLPLQVFFPDSFDQAKSYPTVIAIHGGAWNSLKETPVDWDGGWMGNNVKYYQQKGYVGIVFSYRDFAICPDGVGGILEDCRDAMEYIANTFSFVDANNILLMGDSAGGHLALCLAMNLPNHTPCALHPKKIAVYNPVTDCVSGLWSYCAKEPNLYSPVHHPKKIVADILLMHGLSDSVVSIEESRIFTQKMKEAGNQITMMEIPGAEHAFILFGYTNSEEGVLEALRLTDKHFDL